MEDIVRGSGGHDGRGSGPGAGAVTAPVPVEQRAGTAALVVAVAVAAAVAVCAAVRADGSLWPAVPLPVLVVAVAGLPVRRPARVASAALLVLTTLALCGLEAAGVGGWGSGSAAAAGLVALAGVLAGVVAVWEDHERTEAAARVAAAQQLADAISVVDEVTGCYNANGLDLLARHVIGAVRRSSGAMHASLVEVGDLAAVAAAGGEEAVREVVCGVADALRGSTRGADVVGRWSPDVFVVLGPGTGVTPAELERRLRARLLAGSERPAARWACALTVGSGLLEPWDNGGLADLVARAEQDLALRRALRAPSAAEPSRPGHGRRASDQAADEAAGHAGTPSAERRHRAERPVDPS